MSSRNDSYLKAEALPSTVESERTVHKVFAASRKIGYVARPLYQEQLHNHIHSESPPLIVHAPSGAGKSALVANWIEEFRQREPDTFIIEYYIGSGERTTTHIDLIRHLMLEIKEYFGVTAQLPNTPEGFVRGLPVWLWYVREPIVVVIDALDQLHSEPSATFNWLPEAFPPNLRTIITTNDGSTREELSRRGWQQLTLKPFTLAERRALVRKFVAERQTALTSAQQRAVISAAGSANPLLLRTRLEEVRTGIPGENADATIRFFTGATTLEEMYDRVLQRLESEFPHEDVRNILSFLQAAKTGLTVGELGALTLSASNQIEAILQRIEAYLLKTEDRMVLFHTSLAKAVQQRWLDADSLREMRLRLADYLRKQPATIRSIQEILFQLSEAKADDHLTNFLTDIPTFLLCFKHLQYELLRAWKPLEASVDMYREYRRGLEEYQPEDHVLKIEAIRHLGSLLQIVGKNDAAAELYREGLTIAETTDNDYQRGMLYISLGTIVGHRGDYEKGEDLLEKAKEIMVRFHDTRRAVTITNELAALAFYRDDFLRAEELFQEGLEQMQKVGDTKEEARFLGNIGTVSIRLGHFEKAERYLKKMLAYAEQSGDILMEMQAISNLSVVKTMTEDIDEVILLTERTQQIAEAVGNREQVMTAHGNLGNLMNRLYRLNEAREHCAIQRKIAEELGDHRQLVDALTNLAIAHTICGNHQEAEEMLQLAAESCKRHGNRHGEGMTLSVTGYLALQRDQFADARDAYVVVEQIAKETGSDQLHLIALAGIGQAYWKMKMFDAAKEYYSRLRAKAEELNETRQAVEGLGYEGVVECERGNVEKGLAMIETALSRSNKAYPTEAFANWQLMRSKFLLERIEQGDDRYPESEGEELLDNLRSDLQLVRAMELCSYEESLRTKVEALLHHLESIREQRSARVASINSNI
ncbi:MAG: tetratricopeptide repeat protein [Ignavibacteriae bacterium]|nr:tetratricopeptide repeat protein [Ignavibacteriota bacterium]MCB9216823.1 tetratricopeptide repeat protein [Ignavibacteria bacterium]